MKTSVELSDTVHARVAGLKISAQLNGIELLPTGSRYVGGARADSDYDFFCEETGDVLLWLGRIGYESNDEFHAHRVEIGDDDAYPQYFEKYFPPERDIHVMVLTKEYFPIYKYANERVKKMGDARPDRIGDRDYRIQLFDDFEAIAREHHPEESV